MRYINKMKKLFLLCFYLILANCETYHALDKYTSSLIHQPQSNQNTTKWNSFETRDRMDADFKKSSNNTSATIAEINSQSNSNLQSVPYGSFN